MIMRERIKTIANVAITPVVILFIIIQLFAYVADINLMSPFVLTIYGLFSIVLVIYLTESKIRMFSPFYIVALYTIISHFGFLIVSIVQNNRVFSYLNSNRHVYIEYLPKSLQIASVGVVCLILGFRLNRGKNNNDLYYEKCTLKAYSNNGIYKKYILFALIVYYVYAAILLYLALKYNLFGANYATVKKALSSGSLIVHFRTMFWVATIPIAVFFNKRILKRVIVPGIIIFLVLMFTGNRNDVLYPLAIGYSLYCYKNKKTSRLVNTIAIVILFVINPTISENRSSGGLLSASYSLNITDAIMEMGAQIRPLTVTLSLFSNGTIPHLWGMSMIAPTVADINFGLVYSGNTYRKSIYYIPNILALDNHYGQGYSMVSELWLNFGLIGVILICFFIGYSCASIEKKEVTEKQLMRYGGWTMMLFYWTRNSLQMNFEIVIFTYIMVLLCEKVVLGKRGNTG
ncbi:MAG: O-antigen polysaccharide polymerase Wzy family protein [Saccharofermentans sp.]|nr:O-antigen polysaccharide polymerase Wzy family protein [Saccharofermentans sp.]